MDNLIEQMNAEMLSEMANVTSVDSGLPMNIYVSDKSGISHGPRIKVQTNHSQTIRKDLFVSVSISDNPEIMAGSGLSASDFKIASDFILKNKTALLQYWNMQIGIGELLKQFRQN